MMLLLAAAASMPLPPPSQIVLGAGSIPESRRGPLLPFPQTAVPSATWKCEATFEGKGIVLSGRFNSIEPDPSQNPVPKWAPYSAAQIADDKSHPFAGTYLATYSPNDQSIYGLLLSHGGNAYELTFRLNEFEKPGTVEIMKLQGGGWAKAGAGECSGQYVIVKGGSVE